MRKAILLMICLMMLAVLFGCETAANLPDEGNSKWDAEETATPELISELTPSEMPSVSEQPTDEAPTPEVTYTPTPTPIHTPAHTPIPTGPVMYSSYAHMVSYDPARGLADFDYFDLLQGEDAVKWLVDHEGYTQAAAEAEVAEFADSEYIEKNTNTQLRTIDLDDIPITLMFDPDTGDMLDVNHPLVGSLTDLYNLYQLDSYLVLHTFFYRIEVEDGVVVSVEQFFWP